MVVIKFIYPGGFGPFIIRLVTHSCCKQERISKQLFFMYRIMFGYRSPILCHGIFILFLEGGVLSRILFYVIVFLFFFWKEEFEAEFAKPYSKAMIFPAFIGLRTFVNSKTGVLEWYFPLRWGIPECKYWATYGRSYKNCRFSLW